MKKLSNSQLYSIKNEAVLALGQIEISDDATHVMISIDAHQVKIIDHESPELNTTIRQDRTHDHACRKPIGFSRGRNARLIDYNLIESILTNCSY